MNTRPHSRPLARLLRAALAGTAAATLATPLLAESRFDYAEVIESTPIYRTVEVSVPREECWTEEVVSHRRAHSQSSTPAILGTIIGGALGNAVGHDKSNKRVGAVVGEVDHRHHVREGAAGDPIDEGEVGRGCGLHQGRELVVESLRRGVAHQS